MKRIVTLSFAVAVIAALAVNAAVGKNENYQFVTIEEKPLETTIAYYTDSADAWSGEGFHAGVQLKEFTLTASNVPDGFKAPDTAYSNITMTDMYGGAVFTQTWGTDLKSFFGTLAFVKSTYSTRSSQFTLGRGGQYAATFEVTPIDYTSCDTVVLKDEPSLRIVDATVKLGEDLNASACYTTGYPFSMADFTGTEWAKFTLCRLDTSDNPVETLATGSKTLTLKDEAHPLIAGVDTLKIQLKQPQPGLYRVELTSDWQPGNKSYRIAVNDTIRVTTSLDKAIYYLDTDKAAKLSVHADYGYPYVAPAAPETTPTVALKTKIIDQADSLVIADDTLATRKLNIDEVLSIDLSKVTEEYLEQNNDTVPVSFTITFSGNEMYSKTINLVVNAKSTGVKEIEQAVPAGKQGIYSIDGVKWNCRKEELPRGVYIIDGKKQVIK